jgi:indole-3-glycerol phosphate synthase/phosphoribosylanthranilate isomerase
MSVLNEIVARTRLDVEARKQSAHYFDAPPSRRSFLEALSGPNLALIAEIKRSSPSRGLIREDFDPAQIARIYANHASAISVLTNKPYFGGEQAFLLKAQENAACPILAKDFFIDEFQILEARIHGANAVLLMASVLSIEKLNVMLGRVHQLKMHALVEVHDEAELDAVLKETDAQIIGVNSRDLKTLEIHEEQIFKLAPRVKAAGRVCVAESGIFEHKQVERLRSVADAVLIGSSIMMAKDIAAKIKELGW